MDIHERKATHTNKYTSVHTYTHIHVYTLHIKRKETDNPHAERNVRFGPVRTHARKTNLHELSCTRRIDRSGKKYSYINVE